jgi:hypothetical protein
VTARLPPRRRWVYGLVASTALLLPACGWDGHLDILGYTTRPNYDPSIRTVYVPIAMNVTLRRGLEFELTRALVREIESKIPTMKVVSDRSCADTELLVKIVNQSKALMVFNQLGEIRDGQLTMTAEVVWRDLRPGHQNELLSQPLPGRPADPKPPGPPPQTGPPVVVQALARFTPELGQSRLTAEQTMINTLAVQIVSMMEKPW